MPSVRRLSPAIVVALALSCQPIVPAQGQETAGKGSVFGRVLNATGHPLPGAELRVEGAALRTHADAWGAYRISGLAPGAVTLMVSYLGYREATTSFELAPGASHQLNVTLSPEVFGEMLTVTATPFLEGQAKALNQQKSAINIKNIVAADQIGRFPDPNSAEAAQRIPGVTLQRDQGEGRYVLVRGTEPRLSSAMINGERIPSPERDVRNVALDVIPADLLEAIEVSKALTPDMDGDAIGGAVNLLTKRAPQRSRLTATAGAGYNDQSDDGIHVGNLSYGTRLLADKALGLVVSASALRTDRGSDTFEVEYDDGELDQLELRDYLITRERYGATADLDYRLSSRSEVYFRGIYNDFDDQEIRHRNRSRIGRGRLERELKDRFESQQIVSLSAGGDHVTSSSILVDYRLSWSDAGEDEPGRLDTTFRQSKVDFDPNVSPDAIDPNGIRSNPLNEDIGKYKFVEIAEENNATSDQDLTASLDVSLPFYRPDGASGLWKVGTKLRTKEKSTDINVVLYESDDDIFLVDFLDGGYDPSPFLGGRYQLGPFHTRDTARRLFDGFSLSSDRDLEADLADYDASEDTAAIYGLADLEISSRLRFLGGVRYEATDVDYLASELVLDTDGDPLSLNPVRGSNSYGELLPMAHLVVALDSSSNFRAAITRSLARPDYDDVAPFQLLNNEDLEIIRGNPELEVTTSWNLDLLYEKYLSSVGVLSAGVFYKSMRDNVFDFRFDEIRGADRFDVLQPLNGERATVQGVELAFQNQLRFLPGPWNGLGLYFNYTYADSEATLPERGQSRLPGQAEQAGNFALAYEKAGFSGRLSFNYHGEYITTVGEDPSRDVYIDEHFQIDFAATQRISSKLSIYLELINIGDEPLRVYEGSVDRPIQEEYYSWWGTIGVKLNL